MLVVDGMKDEDDGMKEDDDGMKDDADEDANEDGTINGDEAGDADVGIKAEEVGMKDDVLELMEDVGAFSGFRDSLRLMYSIPVEALRPALWIDAIDGASSLGPLARLVKLFDSELVKAGSRTSTSIVLIRETEKAPFLNPFLPIIKE